MAATTSFQAQLNRPPLHLEGNLVLHKPAKFGVPQSKRGFFVLLKTVLQQYKTETMYHKGQKPIKQFEIRLEEVCGITESLIPNKHYKNCSFSLTMNNGVEHTFSAESTQAMKMWVNGLRLAKEFYAQYYKRERAQQKSQQSMTPCRDTTISYTSGKKEGTEMDVALNSHKPGQDSELARVQVTTWDGVTRRVVVPLVFDVEELLSALSGKIQKCAACPTCKLQRTSMEIWTVDERGIGRKLDREGGTLDVFKLGRHFYVLVHNYKLLIVHFEDNTFQVLPGLVSLKAKEVPYLPIFAAKLSSLGCTNVGLYLVNDQGTSIRFHPEEEPLRYSFSERLVLKSRVLGIAAPISRTRTAIQRERFQKAQQNRKNQNALKRVEQEKCKQHSNFPGRIFNKKAFDPPRNGVVSPLAFDRQTNDHCTTKASSSECEEISLSSTNVSALTLLCDPEDEKRSTEFFDTIIPQADTNDTVIVDDRIVSNGLSADCDDSGIAELQSQENEEIVESSSSESSIESFSPSFPSVSSEPTKDEYMHESDKGTVPGEGDGSINCGDLHKEDGAWEAARDGDGSSSLTSPQSRPSLSTSSSSAAVSEDNFGRSDDESPGRMSDSSISAERGDDILAEEPCEMPESSECKERSVVDFHSCGYTIVGSPRVLHLVVRVCASHKQNEEEVGESNKFSSICLSGWHLKYERGSWSVVDKGRSSIFHSDLADVVKIKLTETILALFNEEDKVWTVVENQKVVKEDSIQLSQIERPIVNCDLNTLEETLDDVNLLWPKMNVGTIELPEEHPIAGEAISTNTNWEQSPEERLRSSIQDIFIHMSAYCDSPKSALSDSKHDGLFEIVRKPLCNALWDLLSVGLRKKTFFRNQTVWNVVNSMKDVSGNVSRTVEWVNSKYACRLDEREKFQVFVCECLNIGRGTLHLWLNCLFMEKQRLTEYYSQEGIMFQRSSEDLERIVMSLSRISSLPFELQSESGIKMRRDINEPAFSFE